MQADVESDGAFGDDLIRGGIENDDLYGQRGNDWIEGNEGEDAIVGDLGKILDNLLGGPIRRRGPGSAADQYISPNAPFLDDDINRTGVLKREVTLYSFDITQPNPATGHDVGARRLRQRLDPHRPGRGPGERQLRRRPPLPRRQQGGGDREARPEEDRARLRRRGLGWPGHDHIYGGYGADFLDVRPRTPQDAPGIVPAPTRPRGSRSPAGDRRPGPDGDVYGDFSGIDFIYGGWDQDTLQANRRRQRPARSATG